MAEAYSTVHYREAPGFPGYRVGDDGTVWSCWTTCRSGRRQTSRWKQMKACPGPRGYLRINLTPPNDRYRTFRLHRLVLLAFVGPCPEGMECRHLDGVKTNCRLDNLAWGTPEENYQDNHDLGVYPKGNGHRWAKLNADQVRIIRQRYMVGSVLLRELASEFHVSLTTVQAIVSRRSWRHLP